MKRKDKLTDKQQSFVNEYIIDFNATRAYRAAGYSAPTDGTAAVEGWKLLRNPKIERAIDNELEIRQRRTQIKADDVLRKLYQTAFGDMKHFVEWGEREEVVDHHPTTGEPIIQSQPYLRMKDMDQVDGTQIGEIKMGKYGIEFKRSDPQKALELLGKHLKLFTDKLETDVDGDIKVNFNIPRPQEDE